MGSKVHSHPYVPGLEIVRPARLFLRAATKILNPHNPWQLATSPSSALLGVLLVGSWDFNFLGFCMKHNKEAKSLTFRRGSEVSQGS